MDSCTVLCTVDYVRYTRKKVTILRGTHTGRGTVTGVHCTVNKENCVILPLFSQKDHRRKQSFIHDRMDDFFGVFRTYTFIF